MMSERKRFERIGGALRGLRASVVLCAILFSVVASPQIAGAAELTIDSFDGAVSNADGTAATAAGSHPYQATTEIMFGGVPGEEVKDIVVDLPPGFGGDPSAVPKCPKERFTQLGCAPSSMVGLSTVNLNGFFLTYPVYNLEPSDDSPAQFGFHPLSVPVVLNATVRSASDYGLSVRVPGIPQSAPIFGTSLTFWGVPADPSHDLDRGVSARGCVGDHLDAAWDPTDAFCGATPTRANVAPRPFLTLPTECAGPVRTNLRVVSWQDPTDWKYASFDSHTPAPENSPVGSEDCDKVPFSPSLSMQPVMRKADTPSGFEVHLRMPYSTDPAGLAQAALKKAVVSLPAGVRVSPPSAAGLGGCTPEQIGLKADGPASCPGNSKIGKVTVTTPLLDKPLTGSIYLAQPTASELIKIYVVVSGSGVQVKLAGVVDRDGAGNLTATFDNNPQLPFTDFALEFNDGPKAPLVLPETCGTYTTRTTFTAWSGKVATSEDSFDVSADGQGTPCGAPGFDPALDAGTFDARGGHDSGFLLRFSRGGRQQDLSSVDVSMPEGLLARIADVDLCPEPAAATGGCGAGSLIGRADVASGAGSEPFRIGGRVYLTGPYKDAPFGLSIVVPAVAGPFDLGLVVVRAAIYVDPTTAAVRVVSDPMPTILQGIPLQIREVAVTIDRPHFMFNPSDCRASSVAAAIRSALGTVADRGALFQPVSCAMLDLQPSLALSLSGKGQTVDGKHPAVTATLTQKPGQANLAKVRVALPLSLALDPDNANGLCEFVDGTKTVPTCPAASIVGTATAITPILDEPLSGPVYFVKNIRKDPKSGREIKTLPKLVIPLVGQNGVRITLTGTSDVVDDQLVTTFDNIPDAPVSSFKLNVNGGKGGILTVSGADICKSTQIADQQIKGQNNKNADADVYIQTPSCPLKVVSKTVGKSSVKVKVGGLGAGKVTVTGRGIKKTTKAISKSTVATVTAKRTKGKPGKVTVSFDPTGPAKARKTSK